MSKHTPGPWAVNPISKCVYAVNKPQDQPAVAAVQDSKDPLQRGFAWVEDEIEREANARLIAAAPDLLDACKAALDWINRFGGHAPIAFGGEAELSEKLSAAIAKATTEEVKG